MKLSICIVTYNRPTDVRRLLDSIEHQNSLPEELVVVDDSDNEQTRKAVGEFRSEVNIHVTYLHREHSSGMTEARNAAVQRTDGDIIAFVDDDVECPPDWVRRLKDSWRTHRDAWAIGGPAFHVNDDGDLIPDIVWSDDNQNWINGYGECNSEDDSWVPSKPIETDQLRGANMSFRSDVLERLGGFNPIYDGSEVYEETDVMARIRRRGGRIIYDPRLGVDHFDTIKAGASTDKESYYWRGFNKVLFRYVCFPETFWLSIARLATVNTEKDCLPIIWFTAAFVKNIYWLWELKGYFDALRHIYRNGQSLPRDTF